ncbi:MAG: peptidylprolyl isomerase [Phycisphaerales bacterium]|nr:MAG: peptidylprolyl isomerase [Phycisphaerales bacterium]
MHSKTYLFFQIALDVVLGMTLASCSSHETVTPDTMSNAWQTRKQLKDAPEVEPAKLSDAVSVGEPDAQAAAGDTVTIASVEGRVITRRRVMDLLLSAHGVNLVEQLIALEAARALAGEKGLSISQSDIDREYNRAMVRLADPLSTISTTPLDRGAARNMLDAILAERNMSHDEFLIVIQRNAYLRAIVESEQVLTEDQLRREYRRLYGQRVRVRHIQLPTPAEAERIRERLAAGEDFGTLASLYSANETSAHVEGLLEAFSRDDETVPQLFRKMAFSLNPGEVSDVLRVGPWYHLLQTVERIGPDDRDFASVRRELERNVRERMGAPVMEALFKELLQRADVRIFDPMLREAFEAKYPDREW